MNIHALFIHILFKQYTMTMKTLLSACSAFLDKKMTKGGFLYSPIQMPELHITGRPVGCLLLSFILCHTGNGHAKDNAGILQPTRDLMPLVGTRTMMQDSEGYVWYGTVEGGLCRDNGYQIDVFRNDRHNPRRIGQSNGILSICEDGNGNIVFGTRKNIFVLDKRDYSIRQLDKDVPDGRVTVLSCNTNGMISAITENGNYTFDKAYRLTGKSNPGKHVFTETTCRFTDRYGNEWTGGINMENRIRIKDNGGMEKTDAAELPAMLENTRADFIESCGGYIGHTNTEVFWTKTIEAQPKEWHRLITIGTRISCVAVSKGGWLYTGDAKGLYRCRYANGMTEGPIETIAKSLGNIRKIAPAPDGGVYFITPRCELAYCGDNGIVTVMQHGAESKALAVAPDGTVWTTDWFGNVFRYDRQQKKLVAEPDACIDSGNPVNAMTCDDKGNLWLVTDKMIKEYTTDGRQRIMHNSSRYIDASQFLDICCKDSHIIVTCSDAKLVINPEYTTKTPHRLALTAAVIDGKTEYAFQDNEITVPCNSNAVELFFSTFNHANAGSVQYAYRMDKGTWQRLDAGNNRITLVNLHKGRYGIEVRATDADGFFRSETLSICLNRLPAWWETWWAYIIYIVLSAATVVAADRMLQRYKAARRKVAELQERLDEYLCNDDAEIDKVAELITDNSADCEFIRRAVAIVEANMGNNALDIDMLCSEMAMSRSSLYRKFADITGQKPTGFVRSIRLRRAAEMIKAGGHSISETAYLCGFSSPSYFNRRFKEMFGVSPTEYR